MDLLRRFVAAAGPQTLRGCLMGLEKESLRVNRTGGIAQTPHPAALGSALTHSYITTDYSEALLELITPPVGSAEEVLRWMEELHRYVYRRIGDEYLWATSMPCILAGEESVPIARYGSSNAGRMKHLYRVGLGYRYGRVMQSIAGVHFNFSLPDDFWRALQRLEGDTRPHQEYVSGRYFGLIRNIKRVGWLVIYLFGASPAVCKSFLNGRSTWLDEFDESTFYGRYATSLRMGDIGYQNNKEHGSHVKPSYNSLDEYVAALTAAIETPSEKYERIGVKVDGEYRQLNANLLQIENEYYSTVRPKQICEGYEKPTLALKRRGVRYIELRSLDVNACEPVGISLEQLRVLHALMLWCLFRESPPIEPHERLAIDRNELAVAHRGREPGLALMRAQDEIGLQVWAREILEGMATIAALLDGGSTGPHQRALAAQRAAVDDPDRTPSARMLYEMRDRAESFHEIAKRLSMTHRQQFLARTPDATIAAQLDALAASSLARQRQMEEEESAEPFDDFLARYFAQRL